MVPLWKSHKKSLKSHWTEMARDSFPTEASKITTSGLIDEIPERQHDCVCCTSKGSH